MDVTGYDFHTVESPSSAEPTVRGFPAELVRKIERGPEARRQAPALQGCHHLEGFRFTRRQLQADLGSDLHTVFGHLPTWPQWRCQTRVVANMLSGRHRIGSADKVQRLHGLRFCRRVTWASLPNRPANQQGALAVQTRPPPGSLKAFKTSRARGNSRRKRRSRAGMPGTKHARAAQRGAKAKPILRCSRKVSQHRTPGG
jgi:hypothetical protein